MCSLTVMVEYLPPLPSVRGPSGEWSKKYVQSLSGILKIVEMVRFVVCLWAVSNGNVRERMSGSRVRERCHW